MNTSAWISLAVTLGVFAVLQRRRGAPSDLVFLGGLGLVTLLGVIDPVDALSGFANPAVVMIGALFVVAAGLRFTGALDLVGQWVLGRATTAHAALLRLAAPLLGLSAFMNNTPIVAMIVPIVVDWCRRRNVSPSRLLIPISYLAIMGGACTLIGTSTNLVVSGMLSEKHAELEPPRDGPPPTPAEAKLLDAVRPMHMFEVGFVGLPCALMGAAYLLVFGHRLLPNRTELIQQLGDQQREYLLEMLVQPECRLIGKSVEDAGLRHLPGLFLIEIQRGERIIAPARPSDVIQARDRLTFTGVVTTIADLENIPGLVPAADRTYEVSPRRRHGRHLTEAVLSDDSPLIGLTVRQARFRQLYNAAVVAVHRSGQRMKDVKIGDIRLRPGDTLLLQTPTEFEDDFRHSRDFSLVASLEGSRATRHDRAGLAFGILVALVAALTTATLLADTAWAAIAAICAAGMMVACRCLPVADARAAIDLHVLLTIAAALGLGLAIDESGAADAIAGGLVSMIGGDSPYLLLAVVYLLTLVFTELITNSAVAALMFPVAMAVAATADWSPRPFVMAIAIAASSSFVTPIGYQTNLMVMGPGGYHPRDYLKAGLPLVVVVMTTALLLIPLCWPFEL